VVILLIKINLKYHNRSKGRCYRSKNLSKEMFDS